MKIPGIDHPITVRPTQGRVTVQWNGQIIADSTRALTLEEAGFAAVQCIPLKDVEAVAPIAGYLAFYPDRVQKISVVVPA